MKIPTGSSAEIEYPSSDGERMSENQWQLDAMIDAINVLRTQEETHHASRSHLRTARREAPSRPQSTGVAADTKVLTGR